MSQTQKRDTQQLAPQPSGQPTQSKPTQAEIGLALGGGGARGLAHIIMLEVFDELGLTPGFIAGTSIGAIFGAAYASGMPAKEIRDFTENLFANRTTLLKRIAQKLPGAVTDLWNPLSPTALNADILLEMLLPERIPAQFEHTKIPFAAIATDYATYDQVVLKSGDLIEAIAASCALPVILQPIRRDGTILIDGGFANPVPFDIVQQHARLTVAIDVNGHPKGDIAKIPSSTDLLLGITQIILTNLLREKLRNHRPDILIRPDVGAFRVLDFFKFKKVLDAAEPCREELKRALEQQLEKRHQPAEI